MKTMVRLLVQRVLKNPSLKQYQRHHIPADVEAAVVVVVRRVITLVVTVAAAVVHHQVVK